MIEKTLKSIRENPLFIKYQVFLMPGVSFVVCIILLVFLIIPQLLSFPEQRSQIESLEAKRNQLETKIEVLNKVDLETYKANISSALIALPQEKDVPGALSQVLFLLSSNRLSLDEISLSGSEMVVDGVKAFQIRVDARGTESSLRSFLENIKGSSRVLSLEKLIVSAGSTSSEVQATMDLIAYYESLPTQVGSVDQEIKLPSQADFDLLDKIRSTQVSTGEVDSSTIPLGKTDLFQ